ncbi:MAG: type II secretion system secretin GspD [Casimicrobiaceae bacterium]
MAASLAACLVVSAPQAFAADEPVTLNFVNADIDAVIKAVAEITGRNFVVDPKVKGTINIVSARPVPRSLVYPTLLSALRMQGYAAIEGEGIVKIVPEADAKQQGGTITMGPVSGGGDRLVTQVITLKYESATQLVNVLRPLITANNTIAAFPNGNALVITDYADNLKRLDKIISSLDQPPGGEPVLVPLRYASAIDIVPLINKLVADAAGAGAAPGTPADVQQRVSVIADPRSNSILLRADNPGRVARLRQLIEQLDTPGRPGGNMFIVYLKNAEAAKVAQTLRSMMTGNADAGAPSSGGNGLSSLSPSTMLGNSTAAAAAPAAPGVAPAPFTPSSSNTFVAGGATITADTANNALVIMAPEPVYNNLRAIIEKLDMRRAQVFVEALICEVSADKSAEFGIQWQALTGINSTQTRVIGGTNFGARGSGNNIIDISASPGSVGQGLALGITKGTLSIPGIGIITNLAFLARALETQVNANILSTPTLLTLDNEEARILVGQNIPILTGQYATTGNTSTVNPFQTFERRDIGLMLRIKPQITEGGTVRLVVYQEVSRLDNSISTNGAGPVISKRVLESSVVIDDSQIVVLGGLIDDQLTDGSDSVPLLGQIPIAGALFRYDARKRTKTNLLVFLKPTVVRTAADGRTITSDRYDYLMGEQQRLTPPERLFWQDTSQPQLPPEGVMPGTPASIPVAPPPPPSSGGLLAPPANPAPGAPSGKP